MSFRPLSSSGIDKRYDVHFNTCRKIIMRHKFILTHKVALYMYLIVNVLDIFANIFVCLEIKSIPL